MVAESPAHFHAYWSGNPNAAPEEESSDAMTLGSAAHHLLLGEEAFTTKFIFRPLKWSDWRTTAAKDWKRLQERAGRTVLLPKMLDAIKGMATSLSRHPLVQAGILNGQIERSLIWQDEETGLWLKARPDAIPADGGDYADLKCLRDVDKRSLENCIADRGYHQQAALVAEGSAKVLRRPLASFCLVAVETAPPYDVRVVEIEAQDIELGMRSNRAALRLIKRCMETGHWPGKSRADAEYIGLPPWTRTRLAERIDDLEEQTK